MKKVNLFILKEWNGKKYTVPFFNGYNLLELTVEEFSELARMSSAKYVMNAIEEAKNNTKKL